MNNRYLIGYGGRDFFMIDVRKEIQDKQPFHYRLNEFLYHSIKSVTVCTDAALDQEIFSKHLIGDTSKTTLKSKIEDDKKVFIAAHRVGIPQIDVFEFFEDKKLRDLDLSSLDSNITIEEHIMTESDMLLTNKKHVVTLEVNETTPNENVQVAINHTGRNIFFAEKRKNSDLLDSYIVNVDEETKVPSQRRLQHLSRNFNVEFCEEDLYNDGFYLAVCKDYDSHVRVMHTHRDYFKVFLDWFVEKGTINFYDLHVVYKSGSPIQTEFLLLGLDHNKFTIDSSKCEEPTPPEGYFSLNYDRRKDFSDLKR